MSHIKLPIMDRLLQAGYMPTRQGRRVRWTRGRCDNVWFDERAIQANSNNRGSTIIRRIAGEPVDSVSIDQQGQQSQQDIWYTDGYRGQKPRRALTDLLGELARKLFGVGKNRESTGD